MQMTRNSFGIFYFLSVGFLLIANAFTGGNIRESLTTGHFVNVLGFFTALGVIGFYASDGSPGYRFVRSYSRHKL